MLINLIITILSIIPVLICIAFFTLLERKVIGAIQRRKGPNVIGILGLLQPFADGLKLILKEIIVPTQANRFLFILAPIWTFSLSLTNWSLIPFNYVDTVSNPSYGLLMIFILSSFGVYGIILAGWSSQSRYPFLGALRSAAQMISYEVSLGIIFIIVTLCSNSLNLSEIILAQQDCLWFGLVMPHILVIFFITILAETNRAPFDLPEAEAEIVAGYNLEYSSIAFALFFLGEYNNILIMSTITAILFLGGWAFPLIVDNYIWSTVIFSFKIIFLCFLFIVVRAAFPRYRYDQLMDIGWKVFFPFTFCYLIFFSCILFIFL